MNVLRFRIHLRSALVSLFDSQCVLRNNGCQISNKTTYSANIPKKVLLTKEEPDELIVANDPDSFGLLSKTNSVFTEKYEHDEGDKKEEEYINSAPLKSSQLSIREYSDIIKEHLVNHRLKEAIDVLEVKMLKEDRVKPDRYIYNLLISGCGRVGYTKKAFMLLNDMKRRGLNVNKHTYTSLFNACANSPWSEDGLSRASRLRNLMDEKGCLPNITNYNSMIKAFGRCGDLEKAFALVDEMKSNKFRIRVHNFNFLFQSCISDKKYGFRHALIVWQKMLSMKEKPNIYSFNLMLRCIKECDIGEAFDLTAIGKINPSLLLTDSSKLNSEVNNFLVSEPNNSISSPIESNLPQKPNINDVSVNQMPNLLAKSPHLGSIISLNEIKTPKDRFMLAGGLDNFLKELEVYNVTPDIKTLTLLLEVIPDTIEVEEKLLTVMNDKKIKPDIDFYNFLMKKRCLRSDYELAKDVLNIIERRNDMLRKKFFKRKTIKLNIMTYGILAMSCQTLKDAENFLNDMKEKRMRVNSEILGTLLKNGTYNKDFDYIFYIMNYAKEDQSTINDIFIKHLEKFKKNCKDKYKNIENKSLKTDKDNRFIDNYTNFLTTYSEWKGSIKINKNTEYDHPWKQFRERQQIPLQRPTMGKVRKTRYFKKRSDRIRFKKIKYNK